MSSRARIKAARRPAKAQRRTTSRALKGQTRVARLGLIGRDLAERAPRITARRIFPVLAASLVVALSLAALRLEVLRLRYALGDAALIEQHLVEEERDLMARHRRLRDPVRLAEEARARGFVRPERLIVLPEVFEGPDPKTTLAAAQMLRAGQEGQP